VQLPKMNILFLGSVEWLQRVMVALVMGVALRRRSTSFKSLVAHVNRLLVPVI